MKTIEDSYPKRNSGLEITDLENARFYEKSQMMAAQNATENWGNSGLSSMRPALENWVRDQPFHLILHFNNGFWNIGL